MTRVGNADFIQLLNKEMGASLFTSWLSFVRVPVINNIYIVRKIALIYAILKIA